MGAAHTTSTSSCQEGLFILPVSNCLVKIVSFISSKLKATREPPRTNLLVKDVDIRRTCTRLDCFLSRRLFSSKSVRLYQYEEHQFDKLVKIAGTCTTSTPNFPREIIVEIAEAFHKNNCFGGHDLFGNNCEGFATSCRTGHPFSEQIHSIKSIPIIGIIAPILAKGFAKLKLSS
ncbi:Gb:AAF32477.1, putative [Theobroma cacao]|uniref:Gb:AAF32477.1, putative n=1 Tax=Theobroma cacao TaxID=3641 RepID=A0A061F1U7_THECC|nr:Gb:AAF32477.1, putative [Theobroma cacao]